LFPRSYAQLPVLPYGKPNSNPPPTVGLVAMVESHIDWKHPHKPMIIKKANKANLNHFQITFNIAFAFCFLGSG
jgi:hypothetical protein